MKGPSKPSGLNGSQVDFTWYLIPEAGGGGGGGGQVLQHCAGIVKPTPQSPLRFHNSTPHNKTGQDNNDPYPSPFSAATEKVLAIQCRDLWEYPS